MERVSNNTPDRHLQMAELVATWSTDPTTRCGAVIVSPNGQIATMATNGLPEGVCDWPDRLVRPGKLLWVEHAERRAIQDVARLGFPLSGCSMYIATIPAGLPPCADCARAIIGVGIDTIYVRGPYRFEERWRESCEAGRQMFQEAEVAVIHIPSKESK